MTEQQIFQLLGLAYGGIGLGLVFNSAYYRKMIAEYLHSHPVVYINGFLTLFVGFLLVTYEFSPRTSMVWIIKIIGWLGLIKGLFILIFPKQYLALARSLTKGTILPFELVFILALAAVMLYIGFA